MEYCLVVFLRENEANDIPVDSHGGERPVTPVQELVWPIRRLYAPLNRFDLTVQESTAVKVREESFVPDKQP